MMKHKFIVELTALLLAFCYSIEIYSYDLNNFYWNDKESNLNFDNCIENSLPLHDVIMQAFYWDVPVDKDNCNGFWWDNLKDKAKELKEIGISAIWTPVPCKGNWGIIDNGYGIYDHYDLGNYFQKGSIETRFGSREELQAMIDEMHSEPRIDVYSDVVLNHIYGDSENEEINPALIEYIQNKQERCVDYPETEISWILPETDPGEYSIWIEGYDCIIEPSPYSIEKNVNKDTCVYADNYKVFLPDKNDIKIRLVAKKDKCKLTGDETSKNDCPITIIKDEIVVNKDKLATITNTHIYYPFHTGINELNYEWNYWHFHPSNKSDCLGDYGDDEVIPNTKIYGNDLNTYNPEVKNRLKNWGKWLIEIIGFDGIRMDFVRGFQEDFAADWIRNLPPVRGCQPFVVGEYWGRDFRIYDWVSKIKSYGVNVHAFDFPLKNILTELCNSNGDEFDMSNLNNAGMIKNDKGFCLQPSEVVTFVDNHDTGKEYDKWVKKDFHLGYAYILFHEGSPCIFYPHYFGDTQHDSNDPSKKVVPPLSLKKTIANLVKIRRKYLGGRVEVLSKNENVVPVENNKNVYIARRKGNGTKDGAILVMNNSDEEKELEVLVNAPSFTDWTGKVLVNVMDPDKILIVDKDGRVSFKEKPRNYSIWVLKDDIE